MKRRRCLQLLSSASLVGLSGCSAVGNIAEAAVERAAGDRVNQIQKSGITTGVAVSEDKFPLRISNSGPTTLVPNSVMTSEVDISDYLDEIDEYFIIRFLATVEEGPPVDVFFTTPSEVAKLTSGERFDIFQGSQMSVTDYDMTIRITDLQDYSFVIDHTYRGEASHDDENATVSYTSFVYTDVN